MAVSTTLGIRRVGYRLAFRALQVVWFVTRPQKEGVKCLVTDGDRVLLVRHTYGRRSWDVPGGAMKRRESPVTAAHREMSEELGLDGAQWAEIGEVRGRLDHRRDIIHCFRAELSAPALTLDRAELETAQWFPRADLPDDLAPYVDEIVGHAPVLSA
jgi:8-oxo-dGTP pyrophosphatase MutT (NUDIX family)